MLSILSSLLGMVKVFGWVIQSAPRPGHVPQHPVWCADTDDAAQDRRVQPPVGDRHMEITNREDGAALGQ